MNIKLHIKGTFRKVSENNSPGEFIKLDFYHYGFKGLEQEIVRRLELNQLRGTDNEQND